MNSRVMFKSLLICTDFEDGLHRLAGFIPSLAASGLQRIVFLHSVPVWKEGEIPRVDRKGMEMARERLSKALDGIPDGVEVHVEVESGPEVDATLRMLDRYDLDAIVLGMHSRTLLREKLFGSTTVKLSEKTTKPLLTMRPQLVSTYTCEELDLRCQHLCRYLLVPYDDTEAAQYLIDRIKHFAVNRPENSLEGCLLTSIIEVGMRRSVPRDYLIDQRREKLAQIQGELQELGLSVDTEVRQGEPLPELLEMAQEYDISAIAVSSRNWGKLLEWSSPSFAGKVLRNSWHPVIFFPPADD